MSITGDPLTTWRYNTVKVVTGIYGIYCTVLHRKSYPSPFRTQIFPPSAYKFVKVLTFYIPFSQHKFWLIFSLLDLWVTKILHTFHLSSPFLVTYIINFIIISYYIIFFPYTFGHYTSYIFTIFLFTKSKCYLLYFRSYNILEIFLYIPYILFFLPFFSFFS